MNAKPSRGLRKRGSFRQRTTTMIYDRESEETKRAISTIAATRENHAELMKKYQEFDRTVL